MKQTLELGDEVTMLLFDRPVRAYRVFVTNTHYVFVRAKGRRTGYYLSRSLDNEQPNQTSCTFDQHHTWALTTDQHKHYLKTVDK